MPIERVHSFLVHASKHAEEQPNISAYISGAQISRNGPLFAMLSSVFNRAHEECDIDIVFRPEDQGRQQNECREIMVAVRPNYPSEPCHATDRYDVRS